MNGHQISASTTWACARGRGGNRYEFIKAECSCGMWSDAFEASDEARRNEVRAAAREHLAGATTQRCRSCGVLIDMVEHEVTRKAAPIEVKASPIGDLELFADPATGAKRYRKVTDAEHLASLRRTGEAYINHFAACPNAAQHHKPTPASTRRGA